MILCLWSLTELNSFEAQVHYNRNEVKLSDHSHLLFRKLTGSVAYFSLLYVSGTLFLSLLYQTSVQFRVVSYPEISNRLVFTRLWLLTFLVVCSKYEDNKIIFLLYHLDYVFIWLKPGHRWIKIINPFSLTYM